MTIILLWSLAVCIKPIKPVSQMSSHVSGCMLNLKENTLFPSYYLPTCTHMPHVVFKYRSADHAFAISREALSI